MLWPFSGDQVAEASVSRDCSAIVLDGLIKGPGGSRMVQFILDTGASLTIVPNKVLRRIGSEKELIGGTVPVQTAGGRIDVDMYRINSLEIMGVKVRDIDVAGYDLPPETRIEGLLGLDFIKQIKLVLDIPNGKLIME
jgi:clan AA aspartic protease (TIGR02281 family)